MRFEIRASEGRNKREISNDIYINRIIHVNLYLYESTKSTLVDRCDWIFADVLIVSLIASLAVLHKLQAAFHVHL